MEDSAAARVSEAPHGFRRGLAALWIALAVLGLALALAAGPLWYYSEQIVGPHLASTLHEQRVLAAEPGRVRLSRDRESLEPGVWALQWEDGFGRVGGLLASDDTSVVREFTPVAGQVPAGGWASLRGISRSANPQTLLGLAYEARAFAGPLGTYPAWFVPGPDSTWVIYVHGIGANRAEGLRTLSVLATRGLPGSLVTYRNDLDAPRSPDGLYHLGLTEWRDIEAAARDALAHGARRLVLASYSMGGHITLQFMARSPLSARVSGVILESPVLDWNATIAYRSHVLRVPGIATWAGKSLAAMRAGLDWRQLDFVADHHGITAPILLFHGVHDQYVPEAVSEAFARALPRQVTFSRIEHANHVEAWNTDPLRYAEVVNHWCDSLGIGQLSKRAPVASSPSRREVP
jgi:pimeloyl-ACP methyl ester carboxylesterase